MAVDDHRGVGEVGTTRSRASCPHDPEPEDGTIITDEQIAQTLAVYLERHPDERGALAEAVRPVDQGGSLASRGSFPLHATAGALLLRGGGEVLLIAHRAYGIWLQPGGHLEPEDDDLPAAALRELVEETGIDPAHIAMASPAPVYVECGLVPARPPRGEPAHWHLDFGCLFTTGDTTDTGQLQHAEVTGAAWYPLDQAARMIGPRVLRAADPNAPITGAGPCV